MPILPDVPSALPPTTPPPPNYSSGITLNEPTPQWDWPNLTNPEKFELLRRELKECAEQNYERFCALQRAFTEHQHAPTTGRVMVEYERRY